VVISPSIMVTEQQVSVCIPAHNEEKHIGGLLSYLGVSRLPEEILVYASGCTDRTETIVEEHSRTDNRIRLLSGPIGKPNAWNELVTHAQSPILVFFDGDVEPRNGCIDELVEALSNGEELIAVGGICKPISTEPGVRKILYETLFSPIQQTGLAGWAYSIKKNRILERMHSHRFDKMPNDLIVEDYWLECMLRRNEFTINRSASVYHPTGTISDFLRCQARTLAARRQIQLKYEQLYHNAVRNFTGRGFLSKIYLKLKNSRNPAELIRTIARGAVRYSILAAYCREMRQVRDELYEEWIQRGPEYLLAFSGRSRTKDK